MVPSGNSDGLEHVVRKCLRADSSPAASPHCHQSFPAVIAPHRLLPRVSSLHLTCRVSRELRVWLRRVVASPAAPAPLLQETWPHFAGTTLHTAACQPPTPSSPAHEKYKSLWPTPPCQPTHLDRLWPASHWLLGNCIFFPLRIVIPAGPYS